MTAPTEAEIRERLARHGLTEEGMASQVRLVQSGRVTLDELDADWDWARLVTASRPWAGGQP